MVNSRTSQTTITHSITITRGKSIKYKEESVKRNCKADKLANKE